MVIARMLLLLLLVFLAAASVAVSAAPLVTVEAARGAHVQRLIRATQAAWPVLATFSPATRAFADIQLVVSDGRQAWVMGAWGGHEVAMANVRELGVDYAYQRYRQVFWQGRPAIFVGLGETLPAGEWQRLQDPQTLPALFGLATHEAFHFHVENGWLRLSAAERSIAYPARVEPRLYRNQIIRQLLAAAQGQSGALARAGYWYRRWLDEHADEVIRLHQVDRSEGAARYVESVAGLLAQGLRPGSPEWSRRRLEALTRQGQEDYLAADLESYVLGDLAGYLLERQGMDWLPRVARGETPLAILLDSVEPVASPVDEPLARRIRRAVAVANRKVAPVLEAFVQRFNDPASGHLLVPHRAMPGSFQVVDSYRLASQPETIEVGVHAGFVLDDGRIDLQAATVATGFKMACGREDLYWIVPLAPAELQKTTQGRLRIERADLKLDIPYPRRAVEASRNWCVAA